MFLEQNIHSRRYSKIPPGGQGNLRGSAEEEFYAKLAAENEQQSTSIPWNKIIDDFLARNKGNEKIDVPYDECFRDRIPIQEEMMKYVTKFDA